MSLFNLSQLGEFGSPKKKSMKQVRQKYSNYLDDSVSHETRREDVPRIPSNSIQARTFLNLTSLNDDGREVQSEYQANYFSKVNNATDLNLIDDDEALICQSEFL